VKSHAQWWTVRMETIRCDNQTNQRSDHGYETNEMKPIPKTSAESQQDLPICYRERERERERLIFNTFIACGDFKSRKVGVI